MREGFLFARLTPDFLSDIAFFTQFGYTLFIMVVRMRHTRSHTANRRAHHALVAPRLSVCKDCGASHKRHTVCINCGKYRGRVVINTAAKAEKKAKKSESMKAAAK